MTTGQIQAPSAFELWWEKKRKTATMVATLVVVAVFAYYLWQFFHRSKIDATWSDFAVKAGFRAGYAEPGELASLAQQNPQYFSFYVGSIASGLVSNIHDHVAR